MWIHILYVRLIRHKEGCEIASTNGYQLTVQALEIINCTYLETTWVLVDIIQNNRSLFKLHGMFQNYQQITFKYIIKWFAK